MLRMGRRKKNTDRTAPPPSPTADRHASRFMVRLPEELRTLLTTLSERTGQTVTAEVVAAIQAHLAAAGLWQAPPEDA